MCIRDRWQKERSEYPGWYILPVDKRAELSSVTRGLELLSEEDQVTPGEMLDFAYELVWRHETGMLEYTPYLLRQVRALSLIHISGRAASTCIWTMRS